MMSTPVSNRSSKKTLVTSSQIADMCGVAINVVSNWKVRYDDFPEPVDRFGNSDVYERGDIVAWLRDHAQKRLEQAAKVHTSAKQNLTKAERSLEEAKAYRARVSKIRK